MRGIVVISGASTGIGRALVARLPASVTDRLVRLALGI